MRTTPEFSLGCKNRGSLRLYESCEEDEDSMVEALAVVVSTIEKTEKAWERQQWWMRKAWRRRQWWMRNWKNSQIWFDKP